MRLVRARRTIAPPGVNCPNFTRRRMPAVAATERENLQASMLTRTALMLGFVYASRDRLV